MNDPAHAQAVVLDGSSLTLEDLVRVAREPRVRVEISDAAMDRVLLSCEQIEEITRRYREDFAAGRAGILDYGITTGFGEFKNIPVAPEQLEELQCNILLSHAVGVGETADDLHPSNFFEPEVVRAALVIRLNAFLRGHSGIRQVMVRTVQAMINRGVIPLVPIRGSVGSSGDLCPLSHTFVVLLGQGRYFRVEEPGDLLFKPRDVRSGLDSLQEDLGIDVPRPSFKEGLALTNGATYTAALLALAVHDSEHLARVADVALSLSLEAVCGCARAFDRRIHEVRGHAGQIASAACVREQLKGSRLIERAGAVQDVYSLRCGPTVHGAARDTIAYARKVVEAEMNAATDNPLFFPKADDWFDLEFRDNWPEGYRGDQRISFSAGNFHGEPVGFAADFLAIGLAELADISERRTQMLLDAHHNRNLPSNLIPHRGVNSGWMIAQYTAAGIVSENKVLTHPATVDSIPTSANTEDHNAMGIIAARKLRTVLRNTQAVLSIELLVAAQGVEWRVGMNLHPLDEQEKLDWKQADEEAKKFRKAVAPKRRKTIAKKLGVGTRRAYLKIRELTPSLLGDDRTLDGDIRAVRAAVERNELV
jgi:histidine ammonia-lyase